MLPRRCCRLLFATETDERDAKVVVVNCKLHTCALPNDMFVLFLSPVASPRSHVRHVWQGLVGAPACGDVMKLQIKVGFAIFSFPVHPLNSVPAAYVANN